MTFSGASSGWFSQLFVNTTEVLRSVAKCFPLNWPKMNILRQFGCLRSISRTFSTVAENCQQSSEPTKHKFVLAKPEFNENFLLDEGNREKIDENIKLRKGVGDINLVHELNDKLRSEGLSHEVKHSITEQLQEELRKVPNDTHPDVKNYGDDPKVVAYYNEKREFSNKPFEFSEICKKLNLLRTDHLGNFAGHKSYFLMSDLAELVSPKIYEWKFAELSHCSRSKRWSSSRHQRFSAMASIWWPSPTFFQLKSSTVAVWQQTARGRKSTGCCLQIFVSQAHLKWHLRVILPAADWKQNNSPSKSPPSAGAFEQKLQNYKRRKEFTEFISSRRLKCFQCAARQNQLQCSTSSKKSKLTCSRVLVCIFNSSICLQVNSAHLRTESTTLRLGCRDGTCGAKFQAAVTVQITSRDGLTSGSTILMNSPTQ